MIVTMTKKTRMMMGSDIGSGDDSDDDRNDDNDCDGSPLLVPDVSLLTGGLTWPPPTTLIYFRDGGGKLRHRTLQMPTRSHTPEQIGCVHCGSGYLSQDLLLSVVLARAPG